MQWVEYRDTRGSLNVGMRVEKHMAVITQIIANRYRKENSSPFTFNDFAPYHNTPAPTLDEWRKAI